MLYPQTLPPPLTELFLHLMTNDSLGHASPRGIGFRGPAFRDPLHQQVHSPTGPFYFWQAPHCKHLPQECQKVLLFPQALSGGTSQAHTQLWILLNYLWMSWLWHFGSIASDNIKLVRTLLYSFHVLNSQWQPTLPLSLKHGTNSSLGPNIKDQWSCVLYNSINILWRTPVKWWSDSRLGPKEAKTGSTNVQNHNVKKPQLQQEAWMPNTSSLCPVALTLWLYTCLEVFKLDTIPWLNHTENQQQHGAVLKWLGGGREALC